MNLPFILSSYIVASKKSIPTHLRKQASHLNFQYIKNCPFIYFHFFVCLCFFSFFLYLFILIQILFLYCYICFKYYLFLDKYVAVCFFFLKCLLVHICNFLYESFQNTTTECSFFLI